MALDIAGTISLINQEAGTGRGQAGMDVLTRTGEKTEQMRINEQLRLEIAEQTGKGLHLDVRG
ncbi:MAG: hypothetical protein R6W66_08215 [Pelovirga sp.]